MYTYAGLDISFLSTSTYNTFQKVCSKYIGQWRRAYTHLPTFTQEDSQHHLPRSQQRQPSDQTETAAAARASARRGWQVTDVIWASSDVAPPPPSAAGTEPRRRPHGGGAAPLLQCDVTARRPQSARPAGGSADFADTKVRCTQLGGRPSRAITLCSHVRAHRRGASSRPRTASRLMLRLHALPKSKPTSYAKL